jgi:hypothetical protein
MPARPSQQVTVALTTNCLEPKIPTHVICDATSEWKHAGKHVVDFGWVFNCVLMKKERGGVKINWWPAFLRMFLQKSNSWGCIHRACSPFWPGTDPCLPVVNWSVVNNKPSTPFQAWQMHLNKLQECLQTPSSRRRWFLLNDCCSRVSILTLLVDVAVVDVREGTRLATTYPVLLCCFASFGGNPAVGAVKPQ